MRDKSQSATMANRSQDNDLRLEACSASIDSLQEKVRKVRQLRQTPIENQLANSRGLSNGSRFASAIGCVHLRRDLTTGLQAPPFPAAPADLSATSAG